MKRVLRAIRRKQAVPDSTASKARAVGGRKKAVPESSFNIKEKDEHGHEEEFIADEPGLTRLSAQQARMNERRSRDKGGDINLTPKRPTQRTARGQINRAVREVARRAAAPAAKKPGLNLQVGNRRARIMDTDTQDVTITIRRPFAGKRKGAQ